MRKYFWVAAILFGFSVFGVSSAALAGYAVVNVGIPASYPSGYDATWTTEVACTDINQSGQAACQATYSKKVYSFGKWRYYTSIFAAGYNGVQLVLFDRIYINSTRSGDVFGITETGMVYGNFQDTATLWNLSTKTRTAVAASGTTFCGKKKNSADQIRLCGTGTTPDQLKLYDANTGVTLLYPAQPIPGINNPVIGGGEIDAFNRAGGMVVCQVFDVSYEHAGCGFPAPTSDGPWVLPNGGGLGLTVMNDNNLFMTNFSGFGGTAMISDGVNKESFWDYGGNWAGSVNSVLSFNNNNEAVGTFQAPSLKVPNPNPVQVVKYTMHTPVGALVPPVMEDLNTSIPAGTCWTLKEANTITNNGRITGWGLCGGLKRAYILSPM
ncbi:hypothetical protein HY249_01885 [Candidatus Azambacteria bacterium]|nr:hypothetical protein [Candidatus Azambacteria bacterium]